MGFEPTSSRWFCKHFDPHLMLVRTRGNICLFVYVWHHVLLPPDYIAHYFFNCPLWHRWVWLRRVINMSPADTAPSEHIVTHTHRTRGTTLLPCTRIMTSFIIIATATHVFCWLLVPDLVQCKFGEVFLVSIGFKRFCQMWDSNPRPHSWTRRLYACIQASIRLSLAP